jgi:hypothetical protein
MELERTIRHEAQMNDMDGPPPHVWGMNWMMIQMVVPIAATAWEVAQIAKDDAFLSEAYTACARWDAWLVGKKEWEDT